jgi:hypothetical protein
MRIRIEVSARCFTNLDKFKREEWPIVFAAVPQKGDKVASKAGVELRVVGVTHSQNIVEGDVAPYIMVELHN